jgi:hypothetical protein
VDHELARIKDLAARARDMARMTLHRKDKSTLLNIAENYEREAAEIVAKQGS